MQHSLATKPISSRKPGRPKKVQRPVCPERLQEIGRRWLRGESSRSIGEKIGVHESTVRHHLKTKILPVWESDLRADLAEELARIAQLESAAWACFDSTAPTEKIESVKSRLLEGGAPAGIVERVVTRIHKAHRLEFLTLVKWCIERRLKIFGHYERANSEFVRQNEFRVAGKTPGEVNEAMLERVARLIQERREYEKAMGWRETA